MSSKKSWPAAVIGIAGVILFVGGLFGLGFWAGRATATSNDWLASSTIFGQFQAGMHDDMSCPSGYVITERIYQGVIFNTCHVPLSCPQIAATSTDVLITNVQCESRTGFCVVPPGFHACRKKNSTSTDLLTDYGYSMLGKNPFHLLPHLHPTLTLLNQIMKYEYLIVNMGGEYTDVTKLNEAGQEGWHIVAYDSRMQYAILERTIILHPPEGEMKK